LGLALEEPKDNDKLYDVGGVEFLISDGVLPYTNEQEVDYVNTSENQGFLIAPVFGGGC
jgi:Fe-S cluster assembly iron-binding protein IscA